MIDYGQPPREDEPEVVVFGPGYGEAIAVHLGAGQWLLVDSCIDPLAEKPAALSYLNSIGASYAAVRAIVVTHWHDDHVRGIGEVAESCPDAELTIPNVLNDKESLAFVSAYSGEVPDAPTRGTKELYRAIASRTNGTFYYFAGLRSMVLDEVIGGRQVKVSAFSPTAASTAAHRARLSSYLPKGSYQPINHAPEIRPNLGAVVLHVQIDDCYALLGSDLEEHRTLGWTAVAADAWVRQKPAASVYKVSHHGGVSGDAACIWSQLLTTKPTCALTPYNRGTRLPSPNDVKRLRELAGVASTSSNASKHPRMPTEVEKRLKDMASDVAVVNSTFGAVRMRNLNGAWRTELFGAASHL